MKRTILLIAAVMFLVACRSRADVEQRGSELVIEAGILRQSIGISGRQVETRSLTVDGEELLASTVWPKSRCFSLEFSRANPDRRPTGIRRGEAAGSVVPLHDASRLVGGATFEDRRPGAVRWEDSIYLSGTTLGGHAGKITHQISRSGSDLTRLDISIPLIKPEMLKGVEIVLHYEVYEKFPVIRKTVEVSNRGKHWLRIGRMLIEDLELGVGFNNPVPLTPRGLGVEASMIGLPSSKGSCGVIAGSEVPAGLRWINESGSMGYAPQLFEWVLGPNEGFTSEPVFLMGFSGEVKHTASAVSTPLDRAVEGPLQQFLDRHVVLPAHSLPLVAPQWLTWASFEPRVDDAIIRRQAEIAARAGFAQLLIDDGWQKDRVGTEIDTEKFPDFAATSKFVRSLGLSLGLWVSDYRSEQSKDMQAMPDARVEPPVILPKIDLGGYRRPESFAMSFASPWREYYARDLVDFSRQYGVNYFKQDFTSLIFGDLAGTHESRTQKESILRSLRGLLAAQDAIRQQAPEIITELTHEIYWGNPGASCDLAVLKHATQYHTPINACTGELPPRGQGEVKMTSDEHRRRLLDGCYNVRQRFFAHRGLPLHRVEFYAIATQNFEGSLTPQVQDRQIASMLLGAPLTFSGDLRWLTDENIAHYRRRFDELARLQKTYDIYRHFQFSGVPAPTDRDWHWWGKLNDAGFGAVVVLRGSGGDESRQINVPWTDGKRTYRVTALMSGQNLGEFTGAQLQDQGVRLNLPLFGQEILELSTP